MYDRCIATLEIIRARARRQSNLLSMAHRGEPFTAVADAQAHPALATLYIINAVSVLDDALEHCMESCASSEQRDKANTLGRRITFLDAVAALSDPTLLRRFKDMRNEFAHEAGRYGSWQDLWSVLEGVEREIKHLQAREA